MYCLGHRIRAPSHDSRGNFRFAHETQYCPHPYTCRKLLCKGWGTSQSEPCCTKVNKERIQVPRRVLKSASHSKLIVNGCRVYLPPILVRAHAVRYSECKSMDDAGISVGSAADRNVQLLSETRAVSPCPI